MITTINHNGATYLNVDLEKDREMLIAKGIDVDSILQKEIEKQNLEAKKLNTDYNGTSVSLTSKDALGLLQVKTAFELGVTKTNFKFQNGTVMEMTPEMFPQFASWFANERNKFFI